MNFVDLCHVWLGVAHTNLLNSTFFPQKHQSAEKQWSTIAACVSTVLIYVAKSERPTFYIVGVWAGHCLVELDSMQLGAAENFLASHFLTLLAAMFFTEAVALHCAMDVLLCLCRVFNIATTQSWKLAPRTLILGHCNLAAFYFFGCPPEHQANLKIAQGLFYLKQFLEVAL